MDPVVWSPPDRHRSAWYRLNGTTPDGGPETASGERFRWPGGLQPPSRPPIPSGLMEEAHQPIGTTVALGRYAVFSCCQQQRLQPERRARGTGKSSRARRSATLYFLCKDLLSKAMHYVWGHFLRIWPVPQDLEEMPQILRTYPPESVSLLFWAQWASGLSGILGRALSMPTEEGMESAFRRSERVCCCGRG